LGPFFTAPRLHTELNKLIVEDMYKGTDLKEDQMVRFSFSQALSHHSRTGPDDIFRRLPNGCGIGRNVKHPANSPLLMWLGY